MTCNPWKDLPLSAPYVLEDDRLAIERFNSKRGLDRRFEIRTSRFPEPFQGSLSAPVVLLTGNPRSNPRDEESAGRFFNSRPDALAAARQSLNHELREYPFWTLNPAFADFAGHLYWRSRLRELVNTFGVHGHKMVAERVLCIEYFPYHSERGSGFPALPSQLYASNLVRQAIARDAVIIIMRKQSLWLRAVPELTEYGRRFRVNSWEAGYITSKNLPTEGWKAVIQAIQEN